MSADLFAEFSAPPAKPQQPSNAGRGQTASQPGRPFSFFDDLSTAAPAPVAQGQPQQTSVVSHDADEGDDWGDFEGGSSGFEAAPAPAPSMKQDPFAFKAPQTSQPSQSAWSSAPTRDDPFAYSAPAPQTSRSSQIAWPSRPSAQNDVAFSAAPQASLPQESWTPAPVIKAKKSADPSVLFDAEDDFEDDDFGDFEGTTGRNASAAQPSGSGGALDLLGDLSLSPTPKATASMPRKESPTSGFGTTARAKKAKADPPPSGTKQDGSWDTFDDWEASIPSNAPAKAPSKPQEQSIHVANSIKMPPPILSPTFDDPQPGELPPTNVPPPALLLTLFPGLFTEAQNKLFKPMAAQTLPMRNKLLSEPATIAYLRGYIMLACVAAQIIAGRKLRWKRDQHLSQGMRIGPASSRATSGMKLSTVDKSENMKEEREALDVVRAWKDQVGRLRHVVSAANQVKAGTLGAVPDIQETMPVKVLNQSEGGVPAREPCMLCGLKRDERVGAADQGVEDSFGEWWIEQVNMHRTCRNFWNEHREKLRQR